MKTITVQDSTWKELTELKIKKEIKTLDKLISEIIKILKEYDKTL